MMKTFKGDFDKFVNMVKNDEHFTLSRWGDGELMILENKPLDLTKKGDGEFKHDPNSKTHVIQRDVLMKSYTYKDKNYYIGVACQCCVGKDKFEYMKKLSGQPEENLTWANIFVNSNYPHFLSEFLPALKGKKICLIANAKGINNTHNLPFDVEKYFPVGVDAWVNNSSLIQYIQQMIGDFNMNNYVFLIAAGPFANILTYELWKYNKNNSYIDIGSTLDKILGLTVTRGYLQGAATLNKTCIW
jgi:hypothetical protein